MKMLKSTLQIFPEAPFDFLQTVTAHGWIGLLPFYWDIDKQQVERIEQLADGSVVHLLIYGNDISAKPEITIQVSHSKQLKANQHKEILKIVGHMLRLDEDFSGFYHLAEKRDRHFSGMNQGFGRLLRSATVFEDVLKTICTTNIQWSGAKRMIRELVISFGKSFDGDPYKKSFPLAEDIAGYSFDAFIAKTNLGYRADYIYSIAKQVSSGELDLQSFLDPEISTSDLSKKLLSIKGIGNYAAATILMLLGHYDEIPVDSVFREFVFKKYFKGKTVSEKRAAKIYQGWGNWKYLAYWYDLTSGQ